MLTNLQVSFQLFFSLGMCLFWWTIWVPEDTCRQVVFLSTSVDMKNCGWVRLIHIFKSIFKILCFQFYRNCCMTRGLYLWSAPSNMVLGIWRFRIVGFWFQHFLLILITWLYIYIYNYDVGLLMLVYYSKRSQFLIQ